MDSDASSRASSPSPSEVEEYESLMRTLIAPLSPSMLPSPALNDENEQVDDGHGGKRSMTKAEKQNAKKRRRKERERELKQKENGQADAKVDSVVVFRLFSSCPVGPISMVEPEEEFVAPINPRLLPINEATASRYRKAALESAVEFPNLGGPSASTTKRIDRELHIVSSEPIHLPEMFIASLPRATEQLVVSEPAPLKQRPTIPTLVLIEPSRKRKRERKPPKPHPPARFWAPPFDLGGKARGYGWGYRDSMEGRRGGDNWDYVRSKDR
ncbi:hypothetical protein P7C73_g5932, partial [Tremellales sp. Uapishka_1]